MENVNDNMEDMIVDIENEIKLYSDNFAHWTSGDSNIDELIQNSQLSAECKAQLIEWIEYSNL
jgi:hypothetical protein